MNKNYFFLFFVLLSITVQSYSQSRYIFAGDSLSKEVIFSDIDDVVMDIDQVTDSWGKPYSTGSECKFDLNEDGINDILVRGSYYFHIVYSSSAIYSVPEPGCSTSGIDGTKVYEYNEKIDDSYKWSDNVSTLVENSNYGEQSVKWENVNNKYLAVKILTQSDTLLGWIKLSIIHVDFYHYKVKVKSYAVQKRAVSQNSEKNKEEIFSVYPNPSTIFINVRIPEFEHESSLVILGVNGEILNRYKILNAQTQINISHLKSGIYFLKLINSEGFVIKKILKQ
jgi:hypothetical protein